MRIFLIKGPQSSELCLRISVTSRKTVYVALATLTEEITVFPLLRTSTKMSASAVRFNPLPSSGSLRVTFSYVQSHPLFACCVQSSLTCCVTTIAMVRFILLCGRLALPKSSHRGSSSINSMAAGTGIENGVHHPVPVFGLESEATAAE